MVNDDDIQIDLVAVSCGEVTSLDVELKKEYDFKKKKPTTV